MRKVMAGMGLLSMPLLSLAVGVVPQVLFVIALVLGGGNILANVTTLFTALVGIAGFTGIIGALGVNLGA
ncbi:MAG: hypothetical protein N0A16_08710 [Blastocatellia bacterium]|nr:hypothetical protein [Blastocatellia bacterium]MCS7157795.1 hypothetical protein [Blastocatellia bacterium]MCX7753308.1 hypothetical protein [Blastocatellia bacterium]MDW8168130.1 hypothetical protein [Acidobacteriota bacterium]MDW8257623.1 hypothetical protein [Acidobacteriota bacterium]